MKNLAHEKFVGFWGSLGSSPHLTPLHLSLEDLGVGGWGGGGGPVARSPKP